MAIYISNGQVSSGRFVVNNSMFIHLGGIASNTTVNDDGDIYVSRGGTAQNTTVNGGGELYVSGGGKANGTIVQGYNNNDQGKIFISSGGATNNTTVNSWGTVYINNNGAANNTTVNSFGTLYVSNGGIATNTTVNRQGDLYISSGGLADKTTVAGGNFYISSGGKADSTTVSSDGCIYISSGGAANHTTVKPGGHIFVDCGGSAMISSWKPGDGYLSIEEGAIVTYFSSYIGVYLGSEGKCVDSAITPPYEMNDKVLNSNTSMYVMNEGKANNTTVNRFGKIYICNGGKANNTTVNRFGEICVSNGGIANNTTVSKFGKFDVFSGGTATAITAHEGASLRITVAPNTYIQGNYDGSDFEMKNAKISGYTAKNYNSIFITSGGMAKNTTVDGGTLYISSGGIHRGSLNIYNSATVSGYKGSVIDFTVADMTVASNYLMNDLYAISGAPTFTITVSGNQDYGTYKLAQGASSFKGTISIGDGSIVYGNVSVNTSALNYNNTTYLLEQQNGNLTLTIKAANITVNKKTPESNLLDNGVSQIVAWDKEKGAVGFVATDGTPGNKWRGIWDWDGKDVELWRVVGVGHFKGSTVDHDGILLYNVVGTTFAAWTNLNDPSYGYVNLCHVEGNFNTKCLTDLDSDQYDDVLIYDEKGSFGVVLDGATYKDIWHVDDAKINQWTLRGAGNFGGKEKQLVVENKSGHLYLWQNNDTTFKTWNWSQTAIGYLGNDFEFVATGDFMGDGIDDILVRNTKDGGIWMWDNGDSKTAHWEVTPGKGFKAEAVGDYNGDGKDDLLVREYNTGWGGLGYYAFGGDQLWNDLNARIETDLESKFAVIA